MKSYFQILFILFLFLSCSNTDDSDNNQTECQPPTNLSVSNISDTTAALNWSLTASGSNYEIEYGISGFTLGTGINNTSFISNFSINNLLPETNYDFYVKTLCDETNSSHWVGPVSFSTLPLILDPPQPFLMTSIDSTTKLIKWNELEGATSYTIIYGGHGFTIGDGSETVILDTTETFIEISHMSWFTFDVYLRANYPNNLSSEWNGPFRSSSNGSNCGASSLDVFPYQQPNRLYLNWGETWQYGYNVSSWTIEYGYSGFTLGNGTTINASNTSSTPPYIIEDLEYETDYDIYIKGNCSNNGQSIYTAFVTVSTSEACAVPYTFEIDEVENNYISINWYTPFNENIELIYGEAGFNIADGISQNYSTNHVEITGLQQNTTYEFYARTTCENGEISDFIGPISATTLN